MIDVKDLRKNFGDVEVLKGIDVKINKGDIVAVIGPSGSGKSTFLRCLNCMEDPIGGSIIFNGVVNGCVVRIVCISCICGFNIGNHKTGAQNRHDGDKYN